MSTILHIQFNRHTLPVTLRIFALKIIKGNECQTHIFKDNIVDSLNWLNWLDFLQTTLFVRKKTGVRYLVFTKNIFPMSQDDFPSDDFPSVYFPIVQFSKRHTFPNVRLDLARRRRLQQGPSTEARTGWGCQARRLGHIWEVSVWENTHRKFSHGKRPLGKYLT